MLQILLTEETTHFHINFDETTIVAREAHSTQCYLCDEFVECNAFVTSKSASLVLPLNYKNIKGILNYN